MRQTCTLLAKNAFELLIRQPSHGLGTKLSRTTWADDCYWTISKVRIAPDGKHGTAYGVLTWRGQQQRPEAPTKVAGPLKKVWRVVQDAGSAQQQQWQSLVANALRQERQAARAAAEEAGAAAAEQPAS
ncbi:hypothetical protein ABPG77_009785 [Micractinium sp. CCAP 211/92]